MYIDSEKLIAEIERLKERAQAERVLHPQTILSAKNYLLIQDYDALFNIITSLQQEQPMPDSTQLIEFWNEDKEMLKEKSFSDDPWRLAYNAFMCGFGRGISVKRQEQPEVDLEIAKK